MSEKIVALLKNYHRLRAVPTRIENDSIIFDYEDEMYNRILSLELAIKELYRKKKLTKEDIKLLNTFVDNETYLHTAKELGISRNTVKKRLFKIAEIIENYLGEDF